MLPRPGQNDAELDRELADALAGTSAEELMASVAPPGAAAEVRPDEHGRVRGRIVAVRGDDVFVDVGGKSEGVLPLSEFAPDAPPQPGQELSFVAQGSDPGSGLLRLSLHEALLDASWESLNVGDVVAARVTGVNKGGLELDVQGIRAFMPAGQVDFERIADFTPLIGTKLEAEVTEVDRRERNLLLSRRRILERQRREAREQLKYTLAEGQVRKGIVRRIVDFGAFVDLGGLEGLLHISDISYGRLKHPSELLRPGDRIDVLIKKIDLVKDRISLGFKQLAPDPWTMAAVKYQVGQTVAGRVLKLMNFGAFVELEPGVEGLIPLSEMTYGRRVGHPKEMLAEGDAVQAVILSVDPEQKRLSLSLKRLGADPWASVAERYRPDDQVSGMVTRVVEFGAFVQLEEGVEGLVHISELAEQRVGSAADVVHAGQIVQVRVLRVDGEQRRIALSMRAGRDGRGAEAPGGAPGDGDAPPAADGSAERPRPVEERARRGDDRPEPRKRKRPLRGGLD